MQVSRSRQLLRDLQRLGCGHARSAGEGGREWDLRGAAAGEDTEERTGIAQKSTGGETKGATKRAP